MTDAAAALRRLDAALAAHRRAADAVTLAAAEVRALLAGEAQPPDAAAEALAALRETAARRGFAVTGDDHVTERDAADLIGRARGTLRAWRAEGRGPQWRKRLGRVEYDLAGLASFMAAGTAPEGC